MDALRRTRVLLTQMTGMLGDIVKATVASQPDMEIVGEPSAPEVPAPTAEPQVDVIVVGRELIEGSAADLRLMCAYQGAGVLGLSTDARRIFRYRLRADGAELSSDPAGPSLQHLVEAIRDAAAGQWESWPSDRPPRIIRRGGKTNA